jgi:TrmH family RNA methyltransferase
VSRPTIIESVQNPRIKQAVRLRDAGCRRQSARFLIDGAREIGLACQHGFEVETIYVSTDSAASLAIQATLQEACPREFERCVQPVSAAVLAKLSYGQRGAEPVAVAVAPQRGLKDFQWSDGDLLLVLDQTEKPGNLGACLRTASACGVSTVILTDPVCEPYNPNAIRASRGTIFSLNVLVATRQEFQALCGLQGIPLFAARVDALGELWQQNFRRGGAVLFGSEAVGLGPEWDRPEHHYFKIPMQGAADSLNLSISSAVTLYEAVRQRQQV